MATASISSSNLTHPIVKAGKETIQNLVKVNEFSMFTQRILTVAKLAFTNVNSNPVFLKSMRLLAIFSIPLQLQSILESISDLRKGKNKVDTSLKLTTEVSSITMTSTGFVKTLGEHNVIEPSSLTWIKPVSLVCSGLKLAGIILSIRNIIRTKRILDTFDKETTPTPNTNVLKRYQNCVKYIKDAQAADSKFTSTYFQHAKNDLPERLEVIEKVALEKITSPNVQDVKEGVQKLEGTLKELRGRIKSTIRSHVVNILISVVALAAIGILYTLSTPIGMGILALISIIGKCRSIYIQRQNAKFEAAIAASAAP